MNPGRAEQPLVGELRRGDGVRACRRVKHYAMRSADGRDWGGWPECRDAGGTAGPRKTMRASKTALAVSATKITSGSSTSARAGGLPRPRLVLASPRLSRCRAARRGSRRRLLLLLLRLLL